MTIKDSMTKAYFKVSDELSAEKALLETSRLFHKTKTAAFYVTAKRLKINLESRPAMTIRPYPPAKEIVENSKEMRKERAEAFKNSSKTLHERIWEKSLKRKNLVNKQMDELTKRMSGMTGTDLRVNKSLKIAKETLEKAGDMTNKKNKQRLEKLEKELKKN